MVTMADRPLASFSAEELGVAWLAVMTEKMAARDENAKAIESLAKEIYLSPDDRSAKGAQLIVARHRLEDELIALGSVLERARREAPVAPAVEPDPLPAAYDEHAASDPNLGQDGAA